MRAIFLDFDGVLNSGEWMKTLKKGKEAGRVYGSDGDQWWIDMIDPAAVAQLNRVIDETGAKVVVSSTWRLRHEPEALQRLLDARGFKGEVIDRTPRANGTKLQLESGEWVFPKLSQKVQRGDEIKYWLHLHPKVTEFVVLDDDSDMDAVRDRYVQTYYQHWTKYPEGELGLGPLAADRAIALMNQD